MQTEFVIETRGPGLVEVTAEVAAWLANAGAGDGLLTLFVRHTSCSLLVQENADPDVRVDLMAFLARLMPENEPWITHDDEGPDDMPAHIKAAITKTSETLPIHGGRLGLGTWQAVYLWEHRSAAHRRRLRITILGETI